MVSINERNLKEKNERYEDWYLWRGLDKVWEIRGVE